MELLERDAALQTMADAYVSATEGNGGTLLISGEAGIGKTSLITVFTQQQMRGGLLLWGSCEALFSPRPLGPLHDFAAALDPELPGRLARDGDRAQLFSSVLEALEKSPATTLVVIEDVHWADAATLDLIKFLARRLARLRVLMLLSYRDDEIGAGHPLRQVLGDLQGRSARRIALTRLSESAVQALARRVGHVGDGVHAVTGGNPFFVTEVLQASGVPASVRDAVTARLARQDEAVRAVIELIAIVPGRLERRLLERALSADDATLNRALDAGLIVEEPDAYAFRHELGRLAVESTLPPARRRELNARMLTALDGLPGVPAARCVHHAAAAGDEAATFRHALSAAAEAIGHGAHREAAALFALALQHTASLEPSVQATLFEKHAYECYLIGEVSTAIASRQRALALWRTLDNAEAQGRNLRWLSRLSWFSGDSPLASTYANAAIALLDDGQDGGETGWAYSNRAQLDMLGENVDAAIVHGERAIAIAERLGDRELLAHALNNVGSARRIADGAVDSELDRSLAIALENGYEEHVARAYVNLIWRAATALDVPSVMRLFGEASPYFCERDLDAWDQYIRATLTGVQVYTGQWAEAGESAQRLLSQPQVAAIARVQALVTLARVRNLRGDSGGGALLDEAEQLARTSGELQRVAPVCVARCEADWIEQRPIAITPTLKAAYLRAVEARNDRWVNELGYWLAMAGDADARPHSDSPWGAMFAGDWCAANRSWARLDLPLNRLFALMRGDEAALREALALAAALGAQAAERHCRDALRRLGARGVPRGPRAGTAAHPAGLTSREVEVLLLLAQGLSNADIAARLVRSQKTVDHHVSAVLGKLGAKTRTEAVAMAHARGLLMVATS